MIVQTDKIRLLTSALDTSCSSLHTTLKKTFPHEDNMCRHTSIKCSGACRCVGSRHRETARRARACLDTILGILSLTGLATPATARTNPRPLTDLTTDKFMRFPYSVLIPWNFYVKDNCALSCSQKRWARIETTPLYMSPCACQSTLMQLKPNNFKESWNSRVVVLLACFFTSQLQIKLLSSSPELLI